MVKKQTQKNNEKKINFRALKLKLINELKKEKEILKQEKEIKKLKLFKFFFNLPKLKTKVFLNKILRSNLEPKKDGEKNIIYIISRFISDIIIKDEKKLKKINVEIEKEKEIENEMNFSLSLNNGIQKEFVLSDLPIINQDYKKFTSSDGKAMEKRK